MRVSIVWMLTTAWMGCERAESPPKDDVFDSQFGDQASGGVGTDGSDGVGTEPVDADADGYTSDIDCDDNNAAVRPGAEEVCDGIDNDCDEDVDEDVSSVYYVDQDGDGYGDDATAERACEPVSDKVEVGGDCDDTNDAVHPLADEVCNGSDDDCDGEVDGPSPVDAFAFYQDADGDGFGTPEAMVLGCTAPPGFASNDQDCFDFDVDINPIAKEYCDGQDTDCNGVVDDGYAIDALMWYPDDDGDGYGTAEDMVTSCVPVAGHSMEAGDCDDGTALVHPYADEACNDRDDNCNGVVDEGFELTISFRDADGDGHGDVAMPVLSCLPLSGYVATGDDCNDAEYWSHPGLVELCDEIDNDCDGEVDEELVYTDFVPDADGDGYGDASGPVRTDCAPPAGHVVDASDCDDSDPSIFPGAVETCNGADDNCNGSRDEGMAEYTYFLDADGDGHGVTDVTEVACALPDGFSESSTDCDDEASSTYPGAYESCDGVDNDCNDLIDDECGSRRDYVMFVTDTFIDVDSSTWLETRADADAYCAEYAATHSIEGSDFRIVYSTPDEAARDYLDYIPGADRVFDRDGTPVGGDDIFAGEAILLPDMMSWTITGTGRDGKFVGCSGSYAAGSWPICQYCDQQFACSSAAEGPFSGGSCCWSGIRAIACMGTL